MVLDIVGLQICVPDLIWTIINFFLLMFLLKQFLYKPILRILDERKAKIEAGLAEGKEAETALEETNAALSEELSAQNGKARELIGKARAEAEQAKENVLNEAHEEAEALRKGVCERINAEENEAKREINENMPELVMMLTKKLLGSDEAEGSSDLIRSCVEESKGN